jgi:flagellar basal-body rod modification protein FlgD
MTTAISGTTQGMAELARLSAGASTSPANQLGKKDFLTLLSAQLQNQDPFAPMENGEFVGQMAQFSTVSGIEALNDSMRALGDRLGGGGRLSLGASLLGRQVQVDGNVAHPDESGAIHGAITLDAPVEALRLRFTDPRTGALMHEMNLGAQPAGNMPFSWDDLPPELAASRGAVRVQAEAVSEGRTSLPAVSVFARIAGVEMPAGSDELTLDVEGYGLLSSLEITALR